MSVEEKIWEQPAKNLKKYCWKKWPKELPTSYICMKKRKIILSWKN